MTLKAIAYQILTTIRGGRISDDERISLKLLYDYIKQYREEFIKESTKVNGAVPEHFRQHTSFDLVNKDHGLYTRLETELEIPKVVINKYGPMIEEIYSSYVDEFPYTIVNRTALRYSGNGLFNKDILFVAYDNNKLYFKSGNLSYKNMDKVSMAAVFQDPELVDGFDVTADDYPVDKECINFIKDSISKIDLKLLLGQFTDEVNDSSGALNK